MSDWRERELGHLVVAAGGYIRTGPFGSQLHASEYTEDPNGVPVVMPKSMIRGKVDPLAISRVDHTTAERLKQHRLASGDVVLARRGDVGRFAYINDDQVGWLCGTGSMRVHVPDHSIVQPLFLRYAMSHPAVTDWFTGHAVGATMPNLNASIVAGLPLRVPSSLTQRRIAAVLSTLDELIEINERRIALLEDLARSLYREWFVHFRFPGHEDVEFVDSELGLIPEAWKAMPFATTGQFFNGFAFRPSDWGTQGTPIIKIKELKEGVTAATPRYNGTQLDPRYLIEPGDLLFSWSADLGVYVWADERGALNQHLFKVSPATGIDRFFLFHALSEALPQFRSLAQGTTMKHIKRSVLSEVQCLVPGPEVFASFAENVTPVHDEVLGLKREIGALAATRDLLLPRLVTGRLDISDVDLGDLLPADAA